MTYLLAIDQGTTNSRAILFNRQGQLSCHYDIALAQAFPEPGWVEQNPEEMFKNTLLCCREVLKKAKLSIKDIAAIGISNQRETTIIWDKKTGVPIYPAIVWQDRRTTALCETLAATPLASRFQEKTGLLLDPYFSATKILWMLEQVPEARLRAERGELLFGTVDCYLIWKLTGGKAHVTDATNASRTLLFNIHTQAWDQEILDALGIPASLLPEVLDSAAHFGDLSPDLFGAAVPISGVAGDQQAAAFGQACFYPGTVKATYGTGAFLLLNTGKKVILSKNKLLTTVAYRLKQEVCYGLEGSIFCAGTTIKWLRDTLRLIYTADETETLAARVSNTEGVYLVPAFTGLGAPYWDPGARAAFLGLTRNSGREHLVRAALESVAYQTQDLIAAMLSDEKLVLKNLRVDGGMAANKWLMQFISDLLSIEIERPRCIETSALGVAYLAGLSVGVYQSLDEISELRQVACTFTPSMEEKKRKTLYQGWQTAVKRVLS
jgi:glycerol kinase